MNKGDLIPVAQAALICEEAYKLWERASNDPRWDREEDLEDATAALEQACQAVLDAFNRLMHALKETRGPKR
jgi:hypothetical protein